MNELEKYSDEEIKKEYWRRVRLLHKKYDIQYNYWEGKVTEEVIEKNSSKFYDRYTYKISPVSKSMMLSNIGENKRFPMHTRVGFKAGTKPSKGDIVRLQYIKHKQGIDYPDESKIIKVIKRNVD